MGTTPSRAASQTEPHVPEEEDDQVQAELHVPPAFQPPPPPPPPLNLLDSKFTGLSIQRLIHFSISTASFLVQYEGRPALLRLRAIERLHGLSNRGVYRIIGREMYNHRLGDERHLLPVLAIRVEPWIPPFIHRRSAAGSARHPSQKSDEEHRHSDPNYDPHATTLHASPHEDASSLLELVESRISNWPDGYELLRIPSLHEHLSALWTVEAIAPYDTLRYQVDRFSFMQLTGLPNVAAVLKVSIQISRGMEALHNAGKVHGRLSSHTIVLQRDKDNTNTTNNNKSVVNQPKSTFPWVALIRDYVNESFFHPQNQLGEHCLQSFATSDLESYPHMSPEALLDGHVTAASDVYSFGIVLWELMTQQVPFKGFGLHDLKLAVIKAHMRPLFPAYVPDEYVRLATQCWSPRPHERPSFSETTLRLQAFLSMYLMDPERVMPLPKNLRTTAGNGGGVRTMSTTAMTPKCPDYLVGLEA